MNPFRQLSRSFILLLVVGCARQPSNSPLAPTGLSTKMLAASQRVTATAGPAATVTAPPSPTAVPAQVPLPPAGYLYDGVYPGGVTGEEDDITLKDLRSYEQTVGKTSAWVYFSDNWYGSRLFPLETAKWIRAAGSIPFIRLMLRSSWEENSTEKLFTPQNIIDGKFDIDLNSWCGAARDFASPILAEYGAEANGSWFPWSGALNGAGQLTGYGAPDQPDGPERFKDAYRHIIQICRAQHATNITWVFHVNDSDDPDVGWNRLEYYYPGDAWIDWIGVSAYGALTPLQDSWPSFRQSMDAAYPRLEALAPSKPIVLLEFGVTLNNPLGDQAVWAQQALTDIVSGRYPRLIGFSWWNESWQNDDNVAHDTTMRVQDNPKLAAVFQELVARNPLVLGTIGP